MYAQDSIELLKQSGIDFAQNETRGIDVRQFGELLTVSGVVLNEDVSWLAGWCRCCCNVAPLLPLMYVLGRLCAHNSPLSRQRV